MNPEGGPGAAPNLVDALQYLFGLEKVGIAFGLNTIHTLSAALGEPHQHFRSLLVAGTNGKGSVVAMIAHALQAAGRRSARYTSPHLHRLEERFVIDGMPVDEATLRTVAEDVRRVSDRLMAEATLSAQPTFFEACTAIAFELFRRAAVEVAVLEVGMGGRLDATNIVTPSAAVITSIDFDHERHLGRTLAGIAREKAGIIKPGVLVVSGERKPEAQTVIAEACRRAPATLLQAQDDVHAAVRFDGDTTVLTLRTPVRDYGDLRLALRGRHQAGNAIIAVRVLEALAPLGVKVPPDAVVAGLTEAAWPGRLERVDLADGRALILDAAHNPAGARALADYVAEVHGGGLPFVFAVMQDKDARRMIDALAPVARHLFVTRPDVPRAADPMILARLARAVRPGLAVTVEPDPARAVARALADAPVAVVAGSIFLVAEIRSLFVPAVAASHPRA